MAAVRSEHDALASLLSVDDHASSRDDDVPSPRVSSNAAAGVNSKLRPWAARTAEATATAKIRASNLTQMNKQPEIALVELAMAGPGKRKQGDKKPRAISRSTDVAAVRDVLLPQPLPLVLSADSACPRAEEESDDSQLESSDQESDRRASRGMLAPSGGAAHAVKNEFVSRGGITADKLHRVRRDTSASSSPGRAGDKMMFGTAAGGVTLPAMIKTVTRSGTHGGGAEDDTDDDGVNNLKHMMQRAEVGLLPHAARTSADGPLDSLGAAGLGLKVLPMTTHSIQVGQGIAANVVHRLVPLPDRGGIGSMNQGAVAAAPAGGYLRGSDPVEVLRMLSAAAAKLRDFARLEGGSSMPASGGAAASGTGQSSGKYKVLDSFSAQNRRL